MRNSVLVLGAAGFIGRHLAETLAESGWSVIAATRSPAEFIHASITNVVGSFDDYGQFMPLLRGCGSIVHCASISTPSSSASQPQLDGNLRTTLSLIEAMQNYPSRRLVYLSSGGTLYGDCVLPANESAPMRPHSYHGAGKAAAEHFIHAWAAQYGGTAIMLRPSNVYGPGQFPRQGFGIVPTAFDCARRGGPLTVWRGDAVRDYLYITDLTELCRKALETELPRGAHVFNAAFGEGTSLDELLDAIDLTTGRPLEREVQSARPMDVHCIVPDSSAARAAFDWEPEVTLKQGLQQTWQWFITPR